MAFEFKLPDIGEGVVEGEIVRWLIQQGDQVAEDQPMVEVMTDKATVEIPSPVSGRVVRTVGAEGEVIEVGSTMVVIETDSDGGPSRAEKRPEKKQAKPAAISERRAPKRPAGKVLATPAVRKLARELSIDLSLIKGTGPSGRISCEDVQRFAQADTAQPEKPPLAAPTAETETIPYRGLRKKIGDHLVAAKRFAPHYTYVEEADATQLVALRKRYLQLHPDSGLTYLPFLVKAVVQGLKRYPLVNATLDEEQKVIQLKKYYNVGVATATDEGLIVPVIKNADQKSILELSQEIRQLSDETRQGRVKLEDLKDGTFTITSLGLMGGVLATPILNYPEVGIMGVHKIRSTPVVREGKIVIREMTNLSLSLDHRVVDGAIGAEFLNYVISFIENPGLLAL